MRYISINFCGKVKSLLLVLFFLSDLKAGAQSCANYTATRTTGIAYNDITATGSAFNAWRNTSGSFTNDDNRSFSTNIGFDFWYLGVRYTSFCVSTNGFIDFSASAADGTGAGPYGYVNSRFSTKTTGTYLALTPFYEDMTTNQANADPLGTDIKYLLSGAAPNRTLTIAWFEMSRFAESTASNLNFQIVLHESTGTIDFVFGTVTFGTATWTYTDGINNASIAGNTPTVVELNCQQTANTATYNNTKKNNLSTVPTSNSQITLTVPVPTAAPTGLTFSGITQTGMTLNWTDNATNEVGYVIYNSTDGVNYTFASQVAANSTSATFALFASTTYYWKVYAVTDGCLSGALSGTQATLPAINIISITTGNWSNTSTWDCTCVPTAADNATIANGHVVTLDANGIVNALAVGQGTSGQLTIGNSATARTLTINTDLTIASGATVTTFSIAATHALTLIGNLTNAGTLNLAPSATRVCNVNLNKSGNQTISGAGATTNFNNITLNMGGSSSNILNVSSTNFTAANNFLTINSGTFKLSSAATVSPFSGATTIKSTDGIWVNNAGAIMSVGATLSFAGNVRASSGILNIGNATDQNLTSTGGALTIDGGTVNVAGRLDRPSLASIDLTYFNISSGTLNLNLNGSTTAGLAPFQMDQTGSTFNMTGGTIIIKNPGAGNLAYLNNGSTYTVTGGTLQMGNATTSAAQTMQINCNVPVYNLTIGNGVSVTAQVTTNSLTVMHDLTITTGTFNPNALTAAVGHDFINNASFTTSGTILFNGTSAQAISGATTTTFSNLTINNTSTGVTLSTPCNVSTTLALTTGLLNTSSPTNYLTMQNGSAAPALTSASTSYVNGPMKYAVVANLANVSVNFPIGKSPDCRPLILTVNHKFATQYNYLAETFNLPADGLGFTLPATVDTVSGVHYVTIDRTDNAGVSQPNLDLNGNQQLRMYFGTNDFVYQGTKLTIVKNTSAAATTWFDVGGTCSFAGNFATPQAGFVTTTSAPSTFTSFSTFALASLNTGWNSLPIDLLNFSAVVNSKNKVDLNWTTRTELNNKYFTIERSNDGQNFTELATKNSKAPNGTSTVKLDYQLTDGSPLSGTSYYRLKQTDYNGKSKSFNVVSVYVGVEKNIVFTVYPNPNIGQFKADFTGVENNHEVQIVLYDEHGKLIYSSSFYAQEATNSVSIIPEHKIGKGVYFCSLIVEGIKHTVKVIVN